MRTIGIRVAPSFFVVAVFDGSMNEIINVEEVKIPKALSEPEALKYARNSILDILREFEVEFAGLRVAESSAQSVNIRRIHVEGVIQEAFASSSLRGYYCGQISTIARKVGIERANFKKIVNGEIEYKTVEGWDGMSKEHREAVLTALGAKND